MFFFENNCFIFLTGKKYLIDWKNVSLEFRKVTKNFVFGTLKFDLSNDESIYFDYQNLNFSNKICGLLGYDTFQSFIINGRLIRDERRMSFLLNEKNPEKYLLII